MSSYINAREPIAAMIGTGDAGCCGGGGPTGAGGASSPQETRSTAAGATAPLIGCGAAGDALRPFFKHGAMGRQCRCWWVALAAVVIIAVVANKS